MNREDITCRFCGSKNVIFKGIQSGHQNCRCKDCHHSFQLGYSYHAYLPEVKEKIISLRNQGASIRKTAQLLQISTTTVLSELKKLKMDKMECK